MGEREALLALADRVESCVPHWHMDDDIAQLALGLPPCGSAGPRAYTTSIDAAVTLVPDGFVWDIQTYCGPAARVVGPQDANGSVPEGISDTSGVTTPAAALCAAALRARAAMMEKTDG